MTRAVVRVSMRLNIGGDVSDGTREATAAEAAAAAAPVRRSASPAGPAGPATLADPAGKAAGENFPVALRALPGRYRRHLMTVYRFARLVDDVGDEGTGGGAERMSLLDSLDEDVLRIPGGTITDPVVRDLAPTVRECGIPLQPFRDLIQSNRQDQAVTRYQTFAELLGYCELSANPVGRIVLHIFGSATPERLHRSDQVCSALQLAEHWQDVAEDFGRGRVYLPAGDLARFGCSEDDLAAPSAGPQLRALMAFETERAARLLDEGAPLVGTLRGYARLAVAGYVAGGRAALAAIAAAGHDVLAATPRPRTSRVAAGLARAFLTGR
jgi:squalene synthase HpnC